MKPHDMGTITITHKDGHTQTWASGDRNRITELQTRFRASILKHVRSDPATAPQYAGKDDDSVFEGYCFQMMCWGISDTPPKSAGVRAFREMMTLDFLLRASSLDPSYPGKLADYLPNHDIEVVIHGLQPAGFVMRSMSMDMPEGIDLSVGITPL